MTREPSDADVMVVFCDGPPDGRHDRRVWRSYFRVDDGWRIVGGYNLFHRRLEDGVVRFRCRTCRFDEPLRLDASRNYAAFGGDYAPLEVSRVFDAQRALGACEIRLRELARLAKKLRSP